MRRWTFSMEPKAVSTAVSSLVSSRPAAKISTKVPSSGRARRMLSAACAIARQNPFYAFSHMQRRERRPRNIPYVGADLELASARFADELREPAFASHLPAIGFPILQNVDAEDPPRSVERNAVVDIKMLADNMVEDEKTEQPLACECFPRAARL